MVTGPTKTKPPFFLTLGTRIKAGGATPPRTTTYSALTQQEQRDLERGFVRARAKWSPAVESPLNPPAAVWLSDPIIAHQQSSGINARKQAGKVKRVRSNPSKHHDTGS
jgi:hypothetical protein